MSLPEIRTASTNPSTIGPPAVGPAPFGSAASQAGISGPGAIGPFDSASSAATPTWSGPTQASLGSIAQNIRMKHIMEAKGILIAIGVLTIIANIVMLYASTSEVDKAIDAEIQKVKLQPGMYVDHAKVAEVKAAAMRTVYLVHGLTIFAGVVFIVLGMNVKRAPVAMTVTGLVLYIGLNAIFGIFDPKTLAQGLIIKVLFAGGLYKAMTAAQAYAKESKQADALATV